MTDWPNNARNSGYVHKWVPEDRLWCVGYWLHYTTAAQVPVSEFKTLRDCGTADEAAAFINYLNGGDGNPFPWVET